jgi:flagellar assembly protein FliH
MAPQMLTVLQGSAACGAVEVVPDAAREPGALIFETERGNLDASVETQLEQIERGLTDRLRR